MSVFSINDIQPVDAAEAPLELADFDCQAVLAEPARALAEIAQHVGPVIIDFDETLYLRNSSEDFLDCLTPGLAGFALLRGMGLFKPWRLTGRRTRDAWRMRAAAFLFPWIWRSWPSRARNYAREFTNTELRDALLVRGDAIIATLGFEPIVEPMLDEMGLGHLRLVACRFGSVADRRKGKLAMLREALGEEAVAQSLVITDAPDDAELLAACAKPMFVLWPDAKFVPALGRVRQTLAWLKRKKRAAVSTTTDQIPPADISPA
jgi:hypothetical protein